MGVSVNGDGRANASSLISSGKVDKTSDWSFAAADGTALLGAQGDDWANYGKWFLGVDDSADAKTKARYKYPFGKHGTVYRSGVVAAKQRAAQQGDTAIETAAGNLLTAIDAAKSASGILTIDEARAHLGMQRREAPVMDRAYSIMTIKALNAVTRTLTGIATTPETDRMGDIVESEGAQYKLPIPFLWQHDSTQPVGEVTAVKTTKTGIEVVIQLAQTDVPGALKDLLDYAWQSIQLGLVKGLSIGFQPVESARIDNTYTYRFLKWLWLELSAVTIPANASATILTVKNISRESMAALGHRSTSGNRPGVAGQTAANSGHPVTKSIHSGETTMTTKSVQEQLAELAGTRETATLRIKELSAIEKWDDAQRGEMQTLQSQVETIDTDMLRKRATMIEMGSAVHVGSTPATGGNGAGAGGLGFARKFNDKEEDFQGQNFVRQVIAKAMARQPEARDNMTRPSDIAEARWGKTNPTLVAVMKANEVSAGGAVSPDWGNALVQANTQYTADFIAFLYKATIYSRLPLRPIPEDTMVKGQDGQATGYMVGEGHAIPASAMSFFDVILSPLKVAALAVISNDLIRRSSPAAEQLVRDGLVQAASQKMDSVFFSAAAAVAGVSPAGILHGVSGTPASGTDSDALSKDIKTLYGPFLAAFNASDLVLCMTPSTAKSISLMKTSLGQFEFPGLKSTGGELLGDTVYTGDNVPAGDVILLKPSDIYRIGDLGITVSVSQEAMIEQSSAPTGLTIGAPPVAASQVFNSMFQTESTAIKVVWPNNFALRRAGVVQLITGANYGAFGT